MATLVSPGVSVTVVDESAYASPGTGTVPLIILATRQDKVDPTGTEADGIAKYTKSGMAGSVVPVTSQRELTQFFGDAVFGSGEGSETSEYGLLAAYSFLGQGSQAYVVRADIDLGELVSSTDAPTGPVASGSYWIDTDASKYGVHEWNGTTWVLQDVTVEVDMTAGAAAVAGTYAPQAAVVNGDYLVAIVGDTAGAGGITVLYFKGVAGSWEAMNSASTNTVTFDAHYNAPAGPLNGDAWVKTTRPGNGIDVAVFSANATGVFGLEDVATVDDTQGGGGNNIKQDGTSVAAQTLVNGDVHLSLNAAAVGGFTVDNVATGAPAAITAAAYAQDDEPTGNPAAGALWFNDTRTDIDVLVRGAAGWERVDLARTIYAVTEPTADKTGGALQAGDIWVDTGAAERDRPALYQHNGTAWVKHDNTDQTTQDGVLFADFTDQTRTALISGSITPLTTAPDHQLYPQGILAVNMAQSKNTVRKWDATASAWRNAVANHADGSGAFGRLAQRKAVATAMQGAVAGNADLRDPMRNFTLLAAPNFPELADELVALNSDRGETGFIILDAPMRKDPTEAVAWVSGNGASENGEDGLVTKNTYSAVLLSSRSCNDSCR